MRLHLNGHQSDVFELWGGGPQGALLTVILFNIYGNWLTDICQPGIPWENRFLKTEVPVTFPRDRIQQTRDCPPKVLPPFESLGLHSCPYIPACTHACIPSEKPNPDPCSPAASPPSTTPSYPPESGSSFVPSSCVSKQAVRGPLPHNDHSDTEISPCTAPRKYCLPVLDVQDGLCHCSHYEIRPHVPYLPPVKSDPFPLCRKELLRLLYIDDASCVEKLKLDKLLVPLLDTHGPQGRMTSCGLGIPGEWLGLQHKLQEITRNAEALGMRVNTNKTKLLVINPTLTKQVVPCVAAYPGNPLLCVGEVRLLGILFDERRVWWPHINDIVGWGNKKNVDAFKVKRGRR